MDVYIKNYIHLKDGKIVYKDVIYYYTAIQRSPENTQKIFDVFKEHTATIVKCDVLDDDAEYKTLYFIIPKYCVSKLDIHEILKGTPTYYSTFFWILKEKLTTEQQIELEKLEKESIPNGYTYNRNYNDKIENLLPKEILDEQPILPEGMEPTPIMFK